MISADDSANTDLQNNFRNKKTQIMAPRANVSVASRAGMRQLQIVRAVTRARARTVRRLRGRRFQTEFVDFEAVLFERFVPRDFERAIQAVAVFDVHVDTARTLALSRALFA